LVRDGFSHGLLGPFYFLQGQKGVARFLKDHVLKTDNGQLIYACYDPSRQVFKYTGENGKQIKDIHAYTLSGIIYPSAIEESKKLNNKFAEDYFKVVGDCDDQIELGRAEIMMNKATDANIEIFELNRDNTVFAQELASLTS